MILNRRIRFMLSLVFLLLAVVCLNKGIDLWTLSGIGQRDGAMISFLGMDLKEVVSNVYLKDYATGFFIAGAALMSIATLCVWRPWKRKKRVQIREWNVRKEK